MLDAQDQVLEMASPLRTGLAVAVLREHKLRQFGLSSTRPEGRREAESVWTAGCTCLGIAPHTGWAVALSITK